MTEEREDARDEAREQAEAKDEEQREAEEAYAQGGQDVEEVEHEEPGAGA